MTNQNEVKQFEGNNKFCEDYINQEQRDEFFLNFLGKLFISIKNHVYVYDNLTNIMYDFAAMIDNHKGGSFVYVPANKHLYCISGMHSQFVENISVEGLVLPDKQKREWRVVNEIKKTRSYFSSCVMNESVIYLFFGFNLHDLEYHTTVEKYDALKPYEPWESITLSMPLKLAFTGIIVSNDEEVYLLGGKNQQNIDNDTIYVIDLTTGIIEDTNMKLPLYGEDIMKYDNKNLFYQESCFLPVQKKNQGLNYCGFDSRQWLHSFDLKTFDYNYINKESWSISRKHSQEEVNKNNFEEDLKIL